MRYFILSLLCGGERGHSYGGQAEDLKRHGPMGEKEEDTLKQQKMQNLVNRIFGNVVNEEEQVFQPTLKAIYASGIGFFVILVFIAAPFGRFYNQKWGPAISGKLSWLTFERYRINTLADLKASRGSPFP
jgi:hypothetical protein